MDRLKKMNRERLAEAIGTRLDLRRKVPRAAPTNNRRRVDVSRREDSEHGFEEGQEESDLGSDL